MSEIAIHDRLLFEDAHIRVFDKPTGLSVLKDNTGRASLAELYADRYYEHPRIAHRIDKGTGGLLIVARSEKCRAALARLFNQRRVLKTYLALVEGKPEPDRGTIRLPLEKARKGKFRVAEPGTGYPSETHYRWLSSDGLISLLEIEPLTGRTHQIRVHLQSIGCPLVKDPLYGTVRAKPSEKPELTLHAWKLRLPHPIEGDELEFEAPVPDWAVGKV